MYAHLACAHFLAASPVQLSPGYALAADGMFQQQHKEGLVETLNLLLPMWRHYRMVLVVVEQVELL